jgi:hypothetical protein
LLSPHSCHLIFRFDFSPLFCFVWFGSSLQIFPQGAEPHALGNPVKSDDGIASVNITSSVGTGQPESDAHAVLQVGFCTKVMVNGRTLDVVGKVGIALQIMEDDRVLVSLAEGTAGVTNGSRGAPGDGRCAVDNHQDRSKMTPLAYATLSQEFSSTIGMFATVLPPSPAKVVQTVDMPERRLPESPQKGQNTHSRLPLSPVKMQQTPLLVAESGTHRLSWKEKLNAIFNSSKKSRHWWEQPLAPRRSAVRVSFRPQLVEFAPPPQYTDPTASCDADAVDGDRASPQQSIVGLELSFLFANTTEAASSPEPGAAADAQGGADAVSATSTPRDESASLKASPDLTRPTTATFTPPRPPVDVDMGPDDRSTPATAQLVLETAAGWADGQGGVGGLEFVGSPPRKGANGGPSQFNLLGSPTKTQTPHPAKARVRLLLGGYDSGSNSDSDDLKVDSATGRSSESGSESSSGGGGVVAEVGEGGVRTYTGLRLGLGETGRMLPTPAAVFDDALPTAAAVDTLRVVPSPLPPPTLTGSSSCSSLPSLLSRSLLGTVSPTPPPASEIDPTETARSWALKPQLHSGEGSKWRNGEGPTAVQSRWAASHGKGGARLTNKGVAGYGFMCPSCLDENSGVWDFAKQRAGVCRGCLAIERTAASKKQRSNSHGLRSADSSLSEPNPLPEKERDFTPIGPEASGAAEQARGGGSGGGVGGGGGAFFAKLATSSPSSWWHSKAKPEDVSEASAPRMTRSLPRLPDSMVGADGMPVPRKLF